MNLVIIWIEPFRMKLTKDQKLVEDVTVINTVSNSSNHRIVKAKILIIKRINKQLKGK